MPYHTKAAAKPRKRQAIDSEFFTRIYVVVMFAIFPLYLNAEKYIHLTQHKAKFFFVFTILFLMSLPILYLARFDGKKKLSGKTPPLKLAFEEWALIGYLLVTLLAAIFTPYPEFVFWGYTERYDGLMTILLYGGIFFAVSRYYNPRELDFLLFAISSMLVSAIGILQYYGVDPFALFPYDLLPGYTEKTIIFRTTLGNVDVVSSYLSVTIALFGMLFVKYPGKYRPWYLAAAALNTYMLMVGGAEAGMAGVLAAFVIAIPYVMERYQEAGRLLFLGFVCALTVFLFNLTNEPALSAKVLQSRWLMLSLLLLALSGVVFFAGPRVKLHWKASALRITGIVLIVILLLGGLAVIEVLGSAQTGGTLYDARQILHGTLPDEAGSYRGYVWKNAFTLLRERTPADQWLIGSGPDTFVNRFEPFRAETMAKFNQYYDKAHNEYLQILFCQGILGLAAYLLFLVGLFRKAAVRAFSDPLLFACSIACLSYLVQAFFSISLPITAPLLWILLGVVHLLCRPKQAGAGGKAPRA